MPPAAYRTLYAGPSARKDAEKKERARWVEILGSMYVLRLLWGGSSEKSPVSSSSQEPGGGHLRCALEFAQCVDI